MATKRDKLTILSVLQARQSRQPPLIKGSKRLTTNGSHCGLIDNEIRLSGGRELKEEVTTAELKGCARYTHTRTPRAVSQKRGSVGYDGSCQSVVPANLRVGFAAASRAVKRGCGRRSGRTGAEPEPKEMECKRYRQAPRQGGAGQRQGAWLSVPRRGERKMRGLCVWLMFEVQIQPLDVLNWLISFCHGLYLSTWSCFRM